MLGFSCCFSLALENPRTDWEPAQLSLRQQRNLEGGRHSSKQSQDPKDSRGGCWVSSRVPAVAVTTGRKSCPLWSQSCLD